MAFWFSLPMVYVTDDSYPVIYIPLHKVVKYMMTREE